MTTPYRLFATAPKGVEPLLQEELDALGCRDTRQRKGGVGFSGTPEDAYRACLWSRTASRVLLVLAEGVPADDADTLYGAVTALPWERQLGPGKTLAVDFVGTTRGITHTRFGAQRVKDAIVDRLRERSGGRPSVDLRNPDLRINVHLSHDQAQVAIDLSGEALYRRGYRRSPVLAPLKENLAAALLLKAGWPAVAGAGGALLDPMCGSGTFVIEAAWIAADRAPGLQRAQWGFQGWLGHQPALWEGVLKQARDRAEAGLSRLPPLRGSDSDRRAVRAAQENAAAAGLGGRVRFEERDLGRIEAPGGSGLLIVNPPYGERLGDIESLGATYALLGDQLKRHFKGWRAALFTGNPDLGKRMGLRALRRNHFYNGALPCVLLQFEVEAERFVDREALDRRDATRALERARSEGGAFFNRIRKNQRIIGKWARREGVSCYRLYDADIPEYAVAVDVYGEHLHVQEYKAPGSVDEEKARQRLEHVRLLLPPALEIAPEKISFKTRMRQRGQNQYQRQASRGEWLQVSEGPARFWINLYDYLDTGLFLDHRPIRHLIGEMARGKRFLNLFCYTATASVHAALGGGASTLSVDLSTTYLDWGRRNLELNGIRPGEHGAPHRLLRADCREWLQRQRGKASFDLIFVDPPTFSTSKRMEGTWDVQRDHPVLLRDALALLAPGGVLLFSTNLRRFRFEQEALAAHCGEALVVEEISRQTLPRDFERNPRIHHCFTIRRGS
ncbi:MAG: bifunctional 23S rRNA (guanine(2069)-N(7))-methyltransferase RlmK/23S rRNA (guanine(2445)-N(2))-methyltransferase RlmL [Candidatus Sedimenticola endophacoides]